MKEILVFGNRLLEQDSLALKVSERLQGKLPGIEFKAVDSLEQLEKKKNLYIMDVAFGIEKVQLVEGLESLKTGQPVSGHDLDFAMQLKILQKIGKLGKVRIIAIPARLSPEKAATEAKGLLTRLGRKNDKGGSSW